MFPDLSLLLFYAIRITKCNYIDDVAKPIFIRFFLWEATLSYTYISTCISFSHRILVKDGYKMWQLNLRASNLIRQLKSSVYIIFILIQCRKLYQFAYFQGLRWKHSHQEKQFRYTQHSFTGDLPDISRWNSILNG